MTYKQADKITRTANCVAYLTVLPSVIAQGSETAPDCVDYIKKNYHTITFDAGKDGQLDGATTYFVDPDREVDLTSIQPGVTANTGQQFIGWNHKLKGQFTQNTTFEATYRQAPKPEPCPVCPIPKPQPKKGTFKEIHIYVTKDEDGKIISTIQSENKVNGYDGDEYTTEKNEKDGFKFKDIQDNPTYSTDGKSTKGKIVGDKNQSITYVYEKVVKNEQPVPTPTPEPTPKPAPTPTPVPVPVPTPKPAPMPAPDPKPESQPKPQLEPKSEQKKLPQTGSDEGYALGMAILGLSCLLTLADKKRKNKK